MRLLIINHVQNAYQSLKNSRVRSMLTMLGVTIGVASITTILALSGGASKIVSDQIDSLGGNIAIVRPGTTIDPVSDITQARPHYDYISSTLNEKDAEFIKNIPHIEAVAPIMMINGTIKADNVAPANSTVLATTPDFAKITKFDMKEGQFLEDGINKDTAVIGSQLSVNIFGTEGSVGRTFTIHGKKLTVIGVIKRLNNPINYNSIDFDNAAIINFSVGKLINQNIAQIQQINIKADSVTNLDKAVSDTKKILSKSHEGETDFSILTGEQISQPTSQLFYAIAGATTAIAAISLVVGGIGIMNIMLVTVAERTREIGIRKALGATNVDISWQFLIESLVISIGGGIGGFIGGYVIAFAISTTFLTFDPIISWQIPVVALAISIVMGTLFGIYPAIRAARKDPIEALHYYD